MAKRRKEHDGCTNDTPKRSRVLNESNKSSSETTLYVPDTPLDKIKQKKCPQNNTDQIDGEKLDFAENSSDDDFSDSDIDMGGLDVDNIWSTYYNYSRYIRYQVMHVEDNGVTKVIHCQNTMDKTSATVRVSGEWYYCEILAGNFLHLTNIKPDSEEVQF